MKCIYFRKKYHHFSSACQTLNETPNRIIRGTKSSFQVIGQFSLPMFRKQLAVRQNSQPSTPSVSAGCLLMTEFLTQSRFYFKDKYSSLNVNNQEDLSEVLNSRWYTTAYPPHSLKIISLFTLYTHKKIKTPSHDSTQKKTGCPRIFRHAQPDQRFLYHFRHLWTPSY